MNKFTSLIISILLISTLAACSSTTVYQPANEGGFGYTEQQLAKDMYWVRYKSRDTDAKKAKDYALLRAAELTLAQGYEWFVVSENDVTGKRLGHNTETNMDIDTVANCTSDMCGNIPASRKYASDGVNIERAERADFTVELKVLFGKGERPEPKFVYDAQQVIATHRAAKD